MPIKECIERVLREYLPASNDKKGFTGHALAHFLRHDFPETVAAASLHDSGFLFKGSAGQSQWVRGPWVCILDPVVTDTPQKGFYPVYLFMEDMKGVYLSLNQGMTESKQLYKSNAKTALKARASNFRAMLGEEIREFPGGGIDLAPADPSNDTAFYEAGNICAKFYAAGRIPEEETLAVDLSRMLRLYSELVFAETNTGVTGSSEGDEPSGMGAEDASKFRLHKRLERNPQLVKYAKKKLGFKCQVCGLDFKDRYGAIGEGFIEAHHLQPLASLKGKKVFLDPEKDFAVLCSNCHRMVHRSGLIDDISAFRETHYREASFLPQA
jgi:5-methylcytosine-specific restriction enzyme A